MKRICEVCRKDMYLKPHRLNRLRHSVHVYERFLTKESREKARNTRRINYLRKLGVFKFEKNAGISIIRRISNIVNNTNAQRLLFLNL